MKRRDFITLLGGAAVAWPVAAGAQQGDRVRRIGVLMARDENDSVAKPLVSALIRSLADLGWTDGRNVRIDLRWAGTDINRIRALAQDLVGLQPDIIFTNATATTAALRRETRTIPIVFVGLFEPVATGIVPRFDRPTGNITGFANYEATLAGKWLELLSEIAPGLKRAALRQRFHLATRKFCSKNRDHRYPLSSSAYLTYFLFMTHNVLARPSHTFG